MRAAIVGAVVADILSDNGFGNIANVTASKVGSEQRGGDGDDLVILTVLICTKVAELPTISPVSDLDIMSGNDYE